MGVFIGIIIGLFVGAPLGIFTLALVSAKWFAYMADDYERPERKD